MQKIDRTPTEEENIILMLWVEFSIEKDLISWNRCMGKFWRGHISALQAAEKYLKKRGLIDIEGKRVWPT